MPISNPLYELFAEKSKQYQNNIAITLANGSTISYHALVQKVEKFSAYLNGLQFSKNRRLIIALPISENFIALMLACLKSSYTYIPLELQQPDSYLKRIINDAVPDFVITDNEHFERFASIGSCSCINITAVESSCLSTSIESENHDDNTIIPVYIIYTSGSTGLPKGVMISVDSLYNLLMGTRNIYHFDSSDRIPILHSVGFDVSVWEICSALFNGAQLLIPPDHIKRSPVDYLDFLQNNNITIANMTPSYFYLVYSVIAHATDDKYSLTHLRLILLAGEVFHAKKIPGWFTSEIFNKIAIYNMYGITEATVHSTFIKITQDMTYKASSLIGSPLPGVDIAVINENNEILHDNNYGQGEIYIGGVSVSMGYFQQPILNEQRYILADFDGKGIKKWLKTGDMVNFSKDGLEYIGRKDKLFKIRGYRINTTDIENTICAYDEIDGTVVAPYTAADDQLRLAAFIRQATAIEANTIINRLKQDLPTFMHPSKFFFVDNFPLTINGKIDTDRLIAENIILHSVINKDNSKLNNIDDVIYVWKRVLNIDEIDLNANFFDLGGDSLLLAKLQHQLQLLLQLEIKMIDLMRYPTITKFVEFISKNTPLITPSNNHSLPEVA